MRYHPGMPTPDETRDPNLHSIYLYKPPATEHMTYTWIYYRVGSIKGADEPGGTLFAPIQMCRVSWPTLADIPPATDTTGITGLASAQEHICNVAKNQWNVDHTDSDLIGFIED
jgi:hypothetical protein